MRWYRSGAFLVACLLVIAGAASGCGKSVDSQAEAAAGRAIYRIPVEVYTLRTERFTEEVAATGILEAEADITLTAEVGGTVRAVAEPVGRALAEAAPVVELDAIDLELALTQAEATLARAKAAYASAQEDAKTDSRLYAQGLAPERQANTMRYAEDMSRAQIDVATAQRDLAQRRVAKTRILSPRAAELSETFVEVGEWVAPGTPVARVVSVDVLKAVVYLSERAVARVAPGQEAWVAVDTYPGAEFAGIVYSVSPTATATTRTYATEIHLPNTGPNRLRPGMAARVRIIVDATDDVVVVPLDAVADAEGVPHVFVIAASDDGPVVRATPVELGRRAGRRATLVHGPPAGTRIVGASVGLLADHAPVQITPAASGS